MYTSMYVCMEITAKENEEIHETSCSQWLCDIINHEFQKKLTLEGNNIFE